MCDKAGTAGYTVGHKLKNSAINRSQHVLIAKKNPKQIQQSMPALHPHFVHYLLIFYPTVGCGPSKAFKRDSMSSIRCNKWRAS